MTLIRAAVLAALAAGGVALAAPAAADSDVFGSYAFVAEDGESATWMLTPCADNAPGCVRVSETGNSKRAPWSGDAHWSVGSLILFVQQPDAILCETGPAAPGMNTYSWDGSSMSGSVSILTNGACGKKAESLSIPFKLTRVGAAEVQPPAAAPAGVAPATPAAAPQAVAPPTALESASPAPSAPLAAESSAGPVGAPPATAPVPTPAPAPG
jgi:hypothetical protein